MKLNFKNAYHRIPYLTLYKIMLKYLKKPDVFLLKSRFRLTLCGTAYPPIFTSTAAAWWCFSGPLVYAEERGYSQLLHRTLCSIVSVACSLYSSRKSVPIRLNLDRLQCVWMYFTVHVYSNAAYILATLACAYVSKNTTNALAVFFLCAISTRFACAFRPIGVVFIYFLTTRPARQTEAVELFIRIPPRRMRLHSASLLLLRCWLLLTWLHCPPE